LVCVVEMGKTAGLYRVSGRSSSVLLRGVLDPTITSATASKICAGIQSWQFAGHVWILRPNRAHKPCETSLIKRAITLLYGLSGESGPNVVFRSGSAFVPRLVNLWHHSSNCPHRIYPTIFSRWLADAPIWWSSCLERRREPFACIITLKPHNDGLHWIIILLQFLHE